MQVNQKSHFTLFFSGNIDFVQTTSVLTFGPSRSSTQCANIQVLTDTVVEDEELLFANLETSDRGVVLSSDTATLRVNDATVVQLSLQQPSYEVREIEDTLTVCAVLSGGSLQRNVLTQLSTESITATGMWSCYRMGNVPMQTCVLVYANANLY